jgi:hypothetical protein
MLVHVGVGDVEIASHQVKTLLSIVNLPNQMVCEIVRPNVTVNGRNQDPPYSLQCEAPLGCPVMPGVDAGRPCFQLPPPRNEHTACETALDGASGRSGVHIET